MREIVLDTETTGFKPEDGHRVIEIGCVELVNHLPSGQTKQWYINPEREVPDDAVRDRRDGRTPQKVTGSRDPWSLAWWLGGAALPRHPSDGRRPPVTAAAQWPL